MNVQRRLGLAFLCGALSFGPPLLAFAQASPPSWSMDLAFNPEAVLADNDIFDVENMSYGSLVSFLSKRGTLGTLKLRDIDGLEKPPADIIWRVANSYKINPKYLLALIQKEQSLVEDSSLTQKQLDWAAGYGVCDNCSMNDPSIQDFKGFANQLEWAAKQHREKYLLQILGKGKTISGFAPGKASVVDGKSLTPKNQATAMLYTYTPHISGNYNLWKIWQRWFSLSFPDGSIVKAATSGKVYQIRYGKKRLYKNGSVLASLTDPNKVIVAEDNQLIAYEDAGAISFPNYSIIETEGKKRYLLVGDKKRLLVGKNTFYKFGFNEDEIINAKTSELADYADGPDLTANSAHPTGILFQDPKKQLWYVEDGVRLLVPHRAFVKLYFQGRIAKPITAKQLEKYKDGGAYQLKDGELVRAVSVASVYVMENGKRRPIPSADVFETIGWQWKNVVTLPDDLLNGYPLGDAVEVTHPMLIEPDASPEDSSTPQVAVTP